MSMPRGSASGTEKLLFLGQQVIIGSCVKVSTPTVDRRMCVKSNPASCQLFLNVRSIRISVIWISLFFWSPIKKPGQPLRISLAA